jgi:glc operon protein GlcG
LITDANPSSLAVVNPAGDLILFERMQGPRPIGIELAIGKARSAAFFLESTQALEVAINIGRPAAITAASVQDARRRTDPRRRHGDGAVGVSGFDKANDVAVAEWAAAAVK